MRESKFQAKLITDLKKLFPGCIIQKLDSGYQQGIPDLLILFNDKWATLECKESKDAKVQPNQKHFVDKMKQMSYSAFIFPENREQVLREIQQAFASRGQARPSQRKQLPLDQLRRPQASGKVPRLAGSR